MSHAYPQIMNLFFTGFRTGYNISYVCSVCGVAMVHGTTASSVAVCRVQCTVRYNGHCTWQAILRWPGSINSKVKRTTLRVHGRGQVQSTHNYCVVQPQLEDSN